MEIVVWIFRAVLVGLALAMPIWVIKIHGSQARMETMMASLGTQLVGVAGELKKLRLAQETTNRILCAAHNIEVDQPAARNGGGGFSIQRGALAAR
jgi:hypothetical protein